MDVLDLAEFVGTSDLCSGLFPLFVRGIQEHTGQKFGMAVRRIVKRIEKIDRKGMHFSASVVSQGQRISNSIQG